MEKNKKKKLTLKFVGEDDWSRPVFKHIHSNYYFGSTNILIPDKPKGLVDEKSIINYFSENQEAIEYFGNSFNCEPHGGMPEDYELIFITKKQLKERIDLLDNNVDKLETHKFAPELNKLWLKNGSHYATKSIDDLKEATKFIFKTIAWDDLKLNLK
jgi:hypothetical protein